MLITHGLHDLVLSSRARVWTMFTMVG